MFREKWFTLKVLFLNVVFYLFVYLLVQSNLTVYYETGSDYFSIYNSGISSILLENSPWIKNHTETFDPNRTNFVGLDNYQLQKYGPEQYLAIWTAVLDERLFWENNETANNLYSVVFLTNRIEIKKGKGKFEKLASKWKCKFQNENETYFGKIRLFTQIIKSISPYFLGCSIEKKYGRPIFGSIITEKRFPVTNNITIEYQYPGRRQGVSICTQPITSLPGSFLGSWHRVVELLEYYKFIGMRKVILPKLYTQDYYYPMDPALRRSLLHYEASGFLETFLAPNVYFVKANKSKSYSDTQRFVSIQASKPMYLTYCFLKNALRYSRILVSDLDETLAYPFESIGKIDQLMNALIRNHRTAKKLRTIKDPKFELDYIIADKMLATNCPEPYETESYKSSSLNRLMGNKSTIFALKNFYTAPGHFGKTILSTRNCVVVFYHYCWVGLQDLNFWKNDSIFTQSKNTGQQRKRLFKYTVPLKSLSPADILHYKTLDFVKVGAKSKDRTLSRMYNTSCEKLREGRKVVNAFSLAKYVVPKIEKIVNFLDLNKEL